MEEKKEEIHTHTHTHTHNIHAGADRARSRFCFCKNNKKAASSRGSRPRTFHRCVPYVYICIFVPYICVSQVLLAHIEHEEARVHGPFIYVFRICIYVYMFPLYVFPGAAGADRA